MSLGQAHLPLANGTVVLYGTDRRCLTGDMSDETEGVVTGELPVVKYDRGRSDLTPVDCSAPETRDSVP